MASGFARYIFMNPYREGLLAPGMEWPWWRRGDGECLDLAYDLTDSRLPPAVWFGMTTAELGVQAGAIGE